MRKLKLIGRIVGAVLTFLLAFMLISNVYCICVKTFGGQEHPKFLGFSSSVVISGSMADTIEVNDLVICSERRSYKVGDIITYISKSGSLVTHRIVGETEEGFITRGDANNTDDREPVKVDSIMGKAFLIIPGVGLVVEFMNTPLGLMCMVFIGISILVLPSYLDRMIGENTGSPQKNGGNIDESENKDS